MESLVHFLMSRRSSGPRPRRPVGRREEGRLLYHSVGCVACHAPDPQFRWPDDAPEEEPIVPDVASVPVADLPSKYVPSALTAFLLDPLATRPGGRMPRLGLSEEEAADIAAYLLGDASTAEEVAWKPDAERVREGARFFHELGCARCHGDPSGARRPLPETSTERLSATPLARLIDTPLTGCLAGVPPAAAPDYSLDERQRRALRAAIALLSSNRSLSAGEKIERTLSAFNCYACHRRAGQGGSTLARARYFRSLEFDMGDEGRFPPPLDEAGRKFKLEALRSILSGEGAVRPYMATRMPDFGIENVAHLPDLLRVADLAAERWPGDVVGRNRFGRELVGTQGMSCISCHDLDGHRSLGMRALDLTLIPERVRPAWFRDYLVDPSAFRPGTRMPSFWPEGETTFPKVLGGKTLQQMDAIWVYLQEVAGTRLPVGMEKNEVFELVPKERPIVLRTFMKVAGTHAIVVGYPAGVHLAFDADAVRLAVVWKGSFMDAESTWDDRFTPLISPLGKDVLELPKAPSFAVLSDADAHWPEATVSAAGYRFEGYRLNQAREPTFLYRWRSVQVEDRYSPLEGARGFERTLRLEGTVEGLWFLAARGRTIRDIPTGSFRIDERWTVSCATENDTTPRRRHGDGIDELRVPVTWQAGKATIVTRLEW